MERGARVDDLDARANDLAQTTDEFSSLSRQVRRHEQWRFWRTRLLLGAIVLAVLLLLYYWFSSSSSSSQ
ncbi:MAG: hypothetical protein MHM6MM_005416 [Cercozoa sp. M6MM]